MSLVDNPLIFVQINGFNFLCIFMALQIQSAPPLPAAFPVRFEFEELEFSEGQAFARRNQTCPLEM